MLKELINAFRQRDVFSELESQIGLMLDAGQWMFEKVADVLMRQVDPNEIAQPLYEKDRRINEIEQKIREQIITHLSLGNQPDLGAGLVLMSVVKDAERIGDYCKNIFEVGKFYRGSFQHREYHEPLQQIRNSITEMFEPAKEAFLNANSKIAKRILRKTKALSKQCDMIIQQLLSTEGDLPADEAVAYVLLARHYKRIEAHLSNIATSIVSPVPLLDFHGKVK